MQFQPILNTIFSKFSWGACPRNPLEGRKKFLLADAWLKNFFRIDSRTLLEGITMKSLTNALITFIINHHPQDMTQKGKTLPSGQSLCTKMFPPGQNRESKAPPPGHKVRKFHRCIYKLSDISSFFPQQMKLFFNEDTDHCNKNYKCKIKSKVSVPEYYTPTIKCLIIIIMFLILDLPLIRKIILIFLALVQSKFEYFSLKMYKISEQPPKCCQSPILAIIMKILKVAKIVYRQMSTPRDLP